MYDWKESQVTTLTALHEGVFHALPQLVHGSCDVKDAKKNRSAQAMITL